MTNRSALQITATHRDSPPSRDNPREAFWGPLRAAEERFSNWSPAQFEGLFKAKFGGHLKSYLLSQLQEARDATELRVPRDGPWRDMEMYFFRGPRGDSERWDGGAYFDMVARLAEARHEAVAAVPELLSLQAKLADSATITFAVGNLRYGSLTFDLSVGSLQKAAKVFDENFESFCVFLEAFVPQAFAEATDDDFARSLEFTIAPGSGIEAAFRASTSPLPAPTRPPAPDSTPTPRDRAEWLWRLANGSLLVPLIISILIMWFGLRELSSIADRQMQYLQPLLQHQLELLREDRLRLQLPAAPGALRDSSAVAPNK